LGEKRYVIRDAKKLKEAAKITPVVDGSGLNIPWKESSG